jgi:hypothetical protein
MRQRVIALDQTVNLATDRFGFVANKGLGRFSQ